MKIPQNLHGVFSSLILSIVRNKVGGGDGAPKYINQQASKSSRLGEEKKLIKTSDLYFSLCHFAKRLRALNGKGLFHSHLYSANYGHLNFDNEMNQIKS